jgi:ribonuclease Z
MVPTKERNVTGIFLSYYTYGLLFDCGEGTQRQMNIAGINRNKVTHVFISHWHGDHVSGLIGLIQTLGNQSNPEEKKTIHIFGPKETEQRMEHLLKTCIFDNRLNLLVHEIILQKQELVTVLDKEEFFVQATRLDHGIPCLGYSFIEKDVRKIDMQKLSQYGLTKGALIGELQDGNVVEFEGKTIEPDSVSTIKKGRKIGIVLDTAPCEGAQLIAEDKDLLICEASYSSAIEEKAENNKHLTARQAALIASNANVKRLILTHISQRYKTGEEVLEDAKDIFSNVEVAYDFMKIKI